MQKRLIKEGPEAFPEEKVPRNETTTKDNCILSEKKKSKIEISKKSTKFILDIRNENSFRILKR